MHIVSLGDSMKAYDKELQMHILKKIPAFEGWYFRFVDTKLSVAIIIGISKAKEKQTAFIQTFNTLDHKIEITSYPLQAFQYHDDPFIVKIADNIFASDYVYLDDPHLSIKGTLHIESPCHLSSSLYAPTIMGPFAYLKRLECNHAIIHLESKVTGQIQYRQQQYVIQATGYQEKDWGTSFPSKYVWLQSNYCLNKQAILFFSCASIPIVIGHFMGIIMVIKIDQKEYRFASYYGARVTRQYQRQGYFYLVIKQLQYQIFIRIKQGPTCTLEAPTNGLMCSKVEESLEGEVVIKIFRKDILLHQLQFIKCGVEIFHFFTKE